MSDNKNEISVLLQASKIIAKSLNPEASINALLELLNKEKGLTKGRVLLADDAGVLRIQYYFGLSDEERQRGMYHIGEGITGTVMETSKIALVPDIRQEPAYLSRASDPLSISSDTVAYIAVPILSENRAIGVLAIYRSKPDMETLDTDINVLTVIAALIKMVLKIDYLVKEKTDSLTEENRALLKTLMRGGATHDIIGRSKSLRGAIKQALQAANSNATVMLNGESGTGKEKFARMIHFASPQKNQPFITINCAAIPDNLLESELFGHVKGSFTGAIKDKIGKFEAADGGTLFLDEIGDMNIELQAKLLRALQEKVIQKVGDTKEIKINVRVITATHKNIKDAVNQGDFRLDLYYRLNVLPIPLPPLREREGDINLLSLFFLNRANQRYKRNITFSENALACLNGFDWPGNIRQLENVIERVVIHAETDRATEKEIQNILNEESSITFSNFAASIKTPIHMMNRPYSRVRGHEYQDIVNAIKLTKGNKTQAALSLGMTPRQLQYRIEKLAIKY